MTADIDDFFEELRREYLREAPARLSELRKDLAAFAAGEADAAKSLKSRFHRLAGSGGSYGFPQISTVSREMERALADTAIWSPAIEAQVEQTITALAQAFDQAANELGLPLPTAKRPGFNWRAIVIGAPGDRRERVTRVLAEAQYQVSDGSVESSPADIPVSERYDLAVLVAPSTAAAVDAWTRPGPHRPGAVVLANDGHLDPLSPPYTDLDLVVRDHEIETELASFAATLGIGATSPPVVLLVEPQSGVRTSLTAWLETGGMRVHAVESAAAAIDALERDAPDVVVLDWHLPDHQSRIVTRFAQRHSRQRLTPVLAVIDGAGDDDRIEALRAGVDQIVERPVSQRFFCAVVQARADRARSIRGLAHRDDLTGLVNPSTFFGEVEHAVGYAGRVAEEFAVIAFDIDHLKRINELHGYQAGDLIIAHVGHTLQSTVRSSDVVGRLGGEEFGVLIRRCSAAHAHAVAEKLRRAVSAHPVRFGEFELTARLSGGIATHPRYGTAAELRREAERGLALAKGTGRDKTVLAESPA
jgi:diguanylate cyclase (GGDEF)-like protein